MQKGFIINYYNILVYIWDNRKENGNYYGTCLAKRRSFNFFGFLFGVFIIKFKLVYPWFWGKREGL